MGHHKQPVCLTIAGLDPSGGAGIIADIKTFGAFGCFGAAAVTSITYQNTVGVFGAQNVSGDAVRRQVQPIFDDLDVVAVKTGMLPTKEVIEAVAQLIDENHPTHFIVDPVVRSTSGFDLIDDEALAVLCETLFPLATLITPNLPEAERISGLPIGSANNAAKAVAKMREMGATNILLKGGHAMDGTDIPSRATDILFNDDKVEEFDAEFIKTNSTHGTGCTLAAGITANLALGMDLSTAIRAAKDFVTEAIRSAPAIGHGHGPIDHLVRNNKS
jgi:hydroxymethylpyrimidine/phosphomethylpyrimidine kinase